VQIRISARHGQLSDALQQYIHQKAEKLLRYFGRLTSIEVTVDLKDAIKEVEFRVDAEHKHDFIARERNGDVRAAVDLIIEKLEQQIKRYKGKVQDHRRNPAMGDIPE